MEKSFSPNPFSKNFNLGKEKNDRVFFVIRGFLVLFFLLFTEMTDEQDNCGHDHRKYKETREQFEDKPPR